MPELLFELGVEELPASAIRRAYTQLEAEILKRLGEAGLSLGVSQSMGTPRRLIVSVLDVAPRQEDSVKAMRGPGLKAAYGPDGAPTGALQGFCRGQGVEVSAVRDDGEYIWVDKQIPGRPTAELLSEILPEAVKALTFDKTMRWGDNRMRFARPIRWILAAYDGVHVPVSIEGVESSLLSRGHRFEHPETFQASTLDALLSELRTRMVEPDPLVREERIRAGALEKASGSPDLKAELVEENVFLTEWPTALEGEFKESYLELPESVLETAMAKHERFFPVRNPAGGFTNKFISIRNGGEDDTVRSGNAWVLNARFNDAKFFFDEDKKKTLAEFLELTERMMFQEKLGSVRKRADRLSKLAGLIAAKTGGSLEEIAFAEQAGLYCKADLSTGLVSELTSLQGVIGGEYARREGLPEPVCHAIAAQYDLSRAGDLGTPGGRTAVRLLVADQLDKLVGYLGLGLEPTGSSDPFGLRRAVTFLIEAAWAWPTAWPAYGSMVQDAVGLYHEQFEAAKIAHSMSSIFVGRYEAMLPEVRYDVRTAATASSPVDDPQAVRFRIDVMSLAAQDTALIQTASRPFNIVAAAVKKGEYEPLSSWMQGLFEGFDDAKLDSAEGMKLAVRAREVAAAVHGQDAKDTFESLKSLQAPINEFFDTTMVNADDPEVRQARLGLVDRVMMILQVGGEFTELVVE